MKIKTIGASPLGGTIYQGTLDTVKSMWVGEKTDITDDCVRATAEHMSIIGKDYCFPKKDGTCIVMTAQVLKEIPDRFK